MPKARDLLRHRLQLCKSCRGKETTSASFFCRSDASLKLTSKLLQMNKRNQPKQAQDLASWPFTPWPPTSKPQRRPARSVRILESIHPSDPALGVASLQELRKLPVLPLWLETRHRRLPADGGSGLRLRVFAARLPLPGGLGRVLLCLCGPRLKRRPPPLPRSPPSPSSVLASLGRSLPPPEASMP